MSDRKRRNPNAAAQDEEVRQYVTGSQSLADLNQQYPNRPRNHSQTLLFSELFKSLFNPLNENKKPTRPGIARAKVGPHGPSKASPQEQRRHIIESFVSRWRKEVGDDFYPALRLIIPQQDRDRGVYGLKESAIGKLLVKIMKIDRNSEDGYNLINWKLPGQSVASRMAGDFAGRCYEVLAKRPILTEPGDMHIGDVNEWLDKLAAASGESQQLPILEHFYQHMNAEEMKWLIRIILKFMKVGATERTFLDMWHPDAETLFSISSSLRRVCWELYDPTFRLEAGDAGVTLMQCFQPQLAQFQFSGSFQKMVDSVTRTNKTEDDTEYWIEEKLDGERMQLHMVQDRSMPGGKRFGFWSRKAKDYNYLYGEGLEDENSSLTRHLKEAFAPGVRNLILDGEMITWDMDLDMIMKFGTLKTAALSEQKNPFSEVGARPLFKVFDILYLNDQPLAQYTLRDRRNALAKAVKGVRRRLEIHEYVAADSPDAIEPQLRRVIAEASEGLVLKNPRSSYRLNSRNDDWIKVKPEYMTGFGEELDLVVIGGYFGSGRRGGNLSSFLCGLRASENDVKAGASPEKCYSFCKVGGGIRAEDYAEIRHLTEGKWVDWDTTKPPRKYIELAGEKEGKQYEKPDVWIRPSESFIISVKAASVGTSDQFARGYTLRFPRFKGLRQDRAWDSALNWQEFQDLKREVEEKDKEEAMKMESHRRRPAKRAKRDVVIAGQDSGGAPAEFEGPKGKTFESLEFCILTDCTNPKTAKAQLENLVKENGGTISQRAVPGTGMLIFGEKRVVKVASLIKAGEVDIIKPKWILDCLAQPPHGFLLPYEPAHIFSATDAVTELAEDDVDEFGDPYARDLGGDEFRRLLDRMPKREVADGPFDKDLFLSQLRDHGHGDFFERVRGHLFRGTRIHIAADEHVSPVVALKYENWVKFGGGALAMDNDDDERVTHVVVVAADAAGERQVASRVRAAISARARVPHVVSRTWLEECWSERTLVDEERHSAG